MGVRVTQISLVVIFHHLYSNRLSFELAASQLVSALKAEDVRQFSLPRFCLDATRGQLSHLYFGLPFYLSFRLSAFGRDFIRCEGGGEDGLGVVGWRASFVLRMLLRRSFTLLFTIYDFLATWLIAS
jgi:hypothetical protein